MQRQIRSRSERKRQRYADDEEYRQRTLAHGHAWRAANKVAINARRRARAVDPTYRERIRALRYGISWEDYRRTLARQGGGCAICLTKAARGLCVDHCHLSGLVRGLLCGKCNCGLGFFEDDAGRLSAAAEYVDAFLAGEQQV